MAMSSGIHEILMPVLNGSGLSTHASPAIPETPPSSFQAASARPMTFLLIYANSLESIKKGVLAGSCASLNSQLSDVLELNHGMINNLRSHSAHSLSPCTCSGLFAGILSHLKPGFADLYGYEIDHIVCTPDCSDAP